MKKIDMTNVQEAGEFTSLPAGPYICTVTDIQDFPKKEYLKVTYDIAQGEFANYFSDARTDHPDWLWYGAYVKSYKTKALPMFKRFCSAISKSNGKFVFDGNVINADERTLVGKKIGLMFREEEYVSNAGEIKTRLIVHSEFPIDKISEQKTPGKKFLKDVPTGSVGTANTTANDFMSIPDGLEEEVPFV